MKKQTLCGIINLMLFAIVWFVMVALPNVLAGHILAWWINLILVLGTFVPAGYIVQYGLSGFVNRLIMGTRGKSGASQKGIGSDNCAR